MAFQFSMDEKGIGTLVFNLPNEKVNKVSFPVLQELEATLDQLKENKSIKALVIKSGKDDVFIAGADLKSFDMVFDDPKTAELFIRTGHRVYTKISELPFPTIAYINGACLGGGMELALACTYRIVSDSPKTLLGLPEVSLGLIPGWGGTQRMPRLVGLIEGMGLILGAKPIKGEKAFKVHLADAIVANEFKEEKIKEFVEGVLTSKGQKKILERRKQKGIKHLLLEANPLGRQLLYSKAKRDILKKTHGNYPSPLLALQVIKESYTLPLSQGLEIEIAAMLKSLDKGAPIAKNLIGLFFTQEALKKDKGVAGDVAIKPIATTAVIGAGVMGSGIAWLLTSRDYPVRMKEVNQEVIGKGFGAVKALYDTYVSQKRLKKSESALKFQKLSATVDYTGFSSADIVIEAATENVELKKKIYAELENEIKESAIIASNTSSLSITDMAKGLKHPERFIGMHFFNPVHRMPLVEVIRGRGTAPQVVATVVDFCKKLGKTPLVVKDCAGFLVNRIFAQGANEVFRLFEEGIPHEKLDKMMLQFGFPMPPFVLADEIGNDTSFHVNNILETAYGKRMEGPQILNKMVENKLYGKKVGKGFYLYSKDKKSFNPEVLQWVKTPSKDMPEMAMIDRVTLVMINEAARCLEEKIVERPDYLDMALIMGVGFPPFRGGLLRYADELGISYVVDHLQKLQKETNAERFNPSPLLLSMQKENKKFYERSL